MRACFVFNGSQVVLFQCLAPVGRTRSTSQRRAAACAVSPRSPAALRLHHRTCTFGAAAMRPAAWPRRPTGPCWHRHGYGVRDARIKHGRKRTARFRRQLHRDAHDFCRRHAAKCLTKCLPADHGPRSSERCTAPRWAPALTTIPGLWSVASRAHGGAVRQ